MHHQSEFDNDVLLDVEDSEIDTSFEFEGMQSSEEGDCLEKSFVNERPEAQACFSSPPINVPDREDSSDESCLNLSIDNSMSDSDDFNDVEI